MTASCPKSSHFPSFLHWKLKSGTSGGARMTAKIQEMLSDTWGKISFLPQIILSNLRGKPIFFMDINGFLCQKLLPPAKLCQKWRVYSWLEWRRSSGGVSWSSCRRRHPPPLLLRKDRPVSQETSHVDKRRTETFTVWIHGPALPGLLCGRRLWRKKQVEEVPLAPGIPSNHGPPKRLFTWGSGSMRRLPSKQRAPLCCALPRSSWGYIRSFSVVCIRVRKRRGRKLAFIQGEWRFFFLMILKPDTCLLFDPGFY